MPERHGYKIEGGAWASGTDVVNGTSVPQTLNVDSRNNNLPPEYKASLYIDFINEYTDAGTDEYVAYIADGSNTTPGNTAGSGGANNVYRYGFNGQEMDNEIEGVGNAYFTFFREYDSRIGRWLSIDPAMSKYPNQSPFVAYNNNPLFFTDPFGNDPPEKFKKHAGKGGDLYLPDSKDVELITTESTGENGERVVNIEGFKIANQTFKAQYDDNGKFIGYFNGKTQYINPDISLVSGGFSGYGLAQVNASFKITGVDCASVEVIQICAATPFNSYWINAFKSINANPERIDKVPLTSEGFIAGQYGYILQGVGKVAAEVDGGVGSYWYYQNGGKTANVLGGPYYGATSWDANSSTLTYRDDISAMYTCETIRFKTIIVAHDFMKSGKDLILGSFSFGWVYEGNFAQHGKNIRLLNNVDQTDLNIIQHYVSSFGFFNF